MQTSSSLLVRDKVMRCHDADVLHDRLPAVYDQKGDRSEQLGSFRSGDIPLYFRRARTIVPIRESGHFSKRKVLVDMGSRSDMATGYAMAAHLIGDLRLPPLRLLFLSAFRRENDDQYRSGEHRSPGHPEQSEQYCSVEEKLLVKVNTHKSIILTIKPTWPASRKGHFGTSPAVP